jgi:tetratricopeptide (TPR) repeat protein
MMRACVLVVVLAASVASADPIDPKVQQKADLMFEQAQGHYQAGQYQAAIPLFKEAYELVHDPVYLFNIAQSYRKVLDCESAYDYYNRYLDAAKDADPKQREKVQGWLRELQPCVDQRQAEHERARKGEEAERQRRLEELRRQQAAAAATRRTEAGDRGHGLRTSGVIAASAGVVGLGAGGAFAVLGTRQKHDLAELCASGCDWTDPDLRAKDRAGHRDNVLAAVGFVGGGVALAGGVTLYLLGRVKVEHVTVAPAPGGATVGARIRF